MRGRNGRERKAVLAHEFGHVWLYAANYPFPQFEEPDSCIAIQAGDAVQHIIIRDEVRRRGIAYLPYWIGNLERLPRCWEDGTAGIRERCFVASTQVWRGSIAAWPIGRHLSDYKRFLAANRRSFPKLESHVEELAGCFRAPICDQDITRRCYGRCWYECTGSPARGGRCGASQLPP
jgi:hypothetical protein